MRLSIQETEKGCNMGLTKYHRLVTLCTILVLLIGTIHMVSAISEDIVRVSVHTDGTEADDDSDKPAISGDGRFIAFVSSASNLVDGDENDVADIFVHDLVTRTTTRVSVASDGTEANATSDSPSISDDGRFVAFRSAATNLASNATGVTQVYVHDRQEPTSTTLVSVNANGDPAETGLFNPSISGCGNYVVFTSQAGNLVEEFAGFYLKIFLRDLVNETTELVSRSIDGEPPNDSSHYPVVSPGGRYVSFTSGASNLVYDDNNGKADVFVYDRQEEVTHLVSVSSEGLQGNDSSNHSSISADGRYVAFHSHASNLVDDDTNSGRDIFVHDRITGRTVRASVSSNGEEGNNLNHEFSDISANGRFVVFGSSSSNFSPEKDDSTMDIFFHDLVTLQTRLVSITANGVKGNNNSYFPRISADGTHVTFVSSANNFVLYDENNKVDIFVKELEKFYNIYLPIMVK